jgi:hypothetical protein
MAEYSLGVITHPTHAPRLVVLLVLELGRHFKCWLSVDSGRSESCELNRQFSERTRDLPKGEGGGVIAAHTVNSPARRSGCRTEVKIGGAGRVGAEAGTEEELPQVECASADISADEILIHGLEHGWGRDVPGKNAVAKAGRKALDLGLDAFGHVDGGGVGDVTVGPEDVTAGRRAGWIEQGWLGEENERALGVTATGDIVFCLRDVLEGSAEMNGDGAATR